MRNDDWKEFFHFTRKETTGIITLLFLLIFIFYLPSLVDHFLPPLPAIRSLENEKMVKELNKLQQESTYSENEKTDAPNYSSGKEEEPRFVSKLFTFDPNTLDDEGWLSLGISKRTVKTIRNYLLKGGRFRKAEDIKRIYGISPSVAENLLPYVAISSYGGYQKKSYDSGAFVKKKFDRFPKETKRLSQGSLDINSADSLDWLAFDGIGPALTHRILKFKEKLGGFYTIAQVAEVYGLPDSTFQQVKPFLQCSQDATKKVSLNAASETELEQHPYIRKKLAKVLVAYRAQHGPFRSVTDLKKIQLIDSDLMVKLAPYISFE